MKIIDIKIKIDDIEKKYDFNCDSCYYFEGIDLIIWILWKKNKKIIILVFQLIISIKLFN